MNYILSKSIHLKIFFAITILSFLILDLFISIYHPIQDVKELNYTDRISCYFFYFTIQANYIVVIYFIYDIIQHFSHNKFSKNYFPKLIATTCITITMVTFWLAILFDNKLFERYDSLNWICTLVLHLIVPIIMITYFLCSSGNYYIDPKKHFPIKFFLLNGYLIFYLLSILFRGYFRCLDNKPEISWFPYSVFNFFQPNGIYYALSGFIMGFIVSSALQYLLIAINNKIFFLLTKTDKTGVYFQHRLKKEKLRFVFNKSLYSGFIIMITQCLLMITTNIILILLDEYVLALDADSKPIFIIIIVLSLIFTILNFIFILLSITNYYWVIKTSSVLSFLSILFNWYNPIVAVLAVASGILCLRVESRTWVEYKSYLTNAALKREAYNNY